MVFFPLRMMSIISDSFKVVIFKFFDNKWQYRTNHTSSPDINKSKNKYELDKVKKGMVITKKKIYK